MRCCWIILTNLNPKEPNKYNGFGVIKPCSFPRMHNHESGVSTAESADLLLNAEAAEALPGSRVF